MGGRGGEGNPRAGPAETPPRKVLRKLPQKERGGGAEEGAEEGPLSSDC